MQLVAFMPGHVHRLTAAYERLAVRAALSGDPADVRKALLAHPLIGQWDVASELIDLLRAASEAPV